MSISTLVLGGARSGKSRLASEFALESCKSPTYLATAQALDLEMAKRIAKHREDRGEHWDTVECSIEIVAALTELESADTVVIDCLTLWLSNLMHNEKSCDAEIDKLCEYIRKSQQRMIFVSNELGLGLVPETELGRSFRDLQGQLNQAVAVVVDEVYFVAAGIPLKLK